MKILYVINCMKQLAGIERILSCKMNYLAEHTTHQTMLSTYEQQGEPISFPLSDKIEYRPFNVPMAERKGHSFIGWIKDNLCARHAFKREFNKVLKELQPEIVIATGYALPVLDIIIDTSRRIGAKTIMESHVQGETVSMTKYIYNTTLRRLFAFWDRHIMNSLAHCDCVVTLTQGDVAYWTKYAPRIEVIPNMLTVDPKPVTDYSVRRVICAGRYAPQKGYDLLIKAWKEIDCCFSDWHLYVFGNGSREPYQALVDRYGLSENVHLMEATPKIVDEFAKSSIYVMSSRFEGFGLVLAEAMACGLPCVSFDCPHGPRDIITDGEDGILVENGNIKALARALEELMNDANLRQSMGEKAINNVSRYDCDVIMKQWEQLFLSI